jgi:hypothetical protein
MPQTKAIAAIVNAWRVIATVHIILALPCGGQSRQNSTRMTFLLTVVGAIVIFVTSQYFLKLVFEPISRVRRTLADISSTTLFHQAKITNGHTDEAVGTRFHELSARLRADAFEVRFYSQVAKICAVPSRLNINAACRELNWLSTGVTQIKQETLQGKSWAEENTRTLEKLGQLLGIDTRF